MQQELARHGIEGVQRFAALDGDTLEKPAGWTHTSGAYGCLRSHLQVIRGAQESGAEGVLIFEDDTMLDPEFQNKFASFIKEVPHDWDMLYLGALHKDEPIKISEHVTRVTKANSTYAYALKSTVFAEFIDLNRRAEHVLDVNAYLLQERFNCYCFMPNLAWVEAEYSDVQNRLERHWYLKQSLVLFGAQVDRLLSQTSVIITHAGAKDAKNLGFLKSYYEEYFSPLIEIVVAGDFNTGIARSDPARKFLILSDSNLYLETLDIRANLRMCETYECATGCDQLIDLTAEQARSLRRTGITRGIDITNNPSSKNGQIRFLNRRVLDAAGEIQVSADRIFHSPNHGLRLPSD